MVVLDTYDSGLGFRALRIEIAADAELEALRRLFTASLGSEQVLSAGSIALQVAIRDQPPWKITERPGGIVTCTISESQAAEVLEKIGYARDHPGEEVFLNEEYEDVVVELVFHRGASAM